MYLQSIRAGDTRDHLGGGGNDHLHRDKRDCAQVTRRSFDFLRVVVVVPWNRDRVR